MFNVKRKIHDKILVYIASIVIVILSAIAIMTFYMVRNYSVNNAKELSMVVAGEANDKMNFFFREVEYLADALSLQRAVYSADASEMSDAFISNVVARKEYIQAIFLGTVNGKIYGRGIGSRYKNFIPILPPDYDPRKRPWYKNALKNTHSVISKPYWFSGDIHKGISLSIQVRHPKTKKLVGVLNIDFRVDVISKIIGLLKVSQGGNAMLFNPKGEVITLRSQDIADSRGKTIASIFNQNTQNIVLKHQRDMLITESAGKKYMVSFVRNEKTGWILLIKIPYDYIMADGYSTLRILNTSYSILIVLVLIILHFQLRTMLTPIMKLAEGAEQVASRNFNYRIEINDKNEIGFLASAYNGMAEKIKQYTDELTEERNLLDKRVKERTQELKEALDEMENLNEIAKEISVSLEFDAVFQKISNYLFKAYGFEGCVLCLIDQNKSNYRIDKVHSQEKHLLNVNNMLGLSFPLNSENDLIAESILTKNKSFVKGEDLVQKFKLKAFQHAEMNSVAVLPLNIEQNVIGAFALISTDSKMELSGKVESSIERFVNQIAIVVRNSKLYELVKEKNEELVIKDNIISQDLQTAKRIQQEVMHFDRDDTGNLGIHVLFKPMIEVGGDIYDIIQLEDGYYRIFLADAVGHGVQAALTTMLIKIEYDNAKYSKETPDKIITLLNDRFISRYINLNVFFSGGLFDIDVKNKKLYYCLAGHPDNVIIKDGNVEILEGGGVVIGMSKNNDYQTKQVPFNRKDKLILMTDGLYEEFSDTGLELDLEGLLPVIEKNKNDSVEAIINRMDEFVHHFIGSGPVNDDITAIGIEFVS